MKVPVLLIQKGTGILKVLGSGSFRKSWVLLDYTDWCIITILGVIGLILLKVIFDPMLACLTLVGDSSLSIIQRLSSVIVPATTVSWIHNKNTPQLELKELEDVENRISELEDQMQLFKNVMVRNVNFNASKRMSLAEESV